MPKMCTLEGSTEEIRRGKIPGNFISYVENYCDLTPTSENKGIRLLHHDFNKQASECQTNYH